MSNAVRQLQHLVTDDPCIECHELFNSEAKNGATGGLCGKAHERQISELVYQKKAEKILADENCMKIFIVSVDVALTGVRSSYVVPDNVSHKITLFFSTINQVA